MNTMTCPKCGGAVHTKNKVKISRLGGLEVQRYYCPKVCKAYHLRDIASGDLIELPPRGPSAPRAPKEQDALAEIAQAMGIDVDLLAVRMVDKGRPRFLFTGMTQPELDAADTPDVIAHMVATKAALAAEAVLAYLKARAKARVS